MANSRRSRLDTLERRRDWLRKTADNQSAKQELDALAWAIETLMDCLPIIGTPDAPSQRLQGSTHSTTAAAESKDKTNGPTTTD